MDGDARWGRGRVALRLPDEPRNTTCAHHNSLLMHNPHTRTREAAVLVEPPRRRGDGRGEVAPVHEVIRHGVTPHDAEVPFGGVRHVLVEDVVLAVEIQGAVRVVDPALLGLRGEQAGRSKVGDVGPGTSSASPGHACGAVRCLLRVSRRWHSRGRGIWVGPSRRCRARAPSV